MACRWDVDRLQLQCISPALAKAFGNLHTVASMHLCMGNWHGEGNPAHGENEHRSDTQRSSLESCATLCRLFAAGLQLIAFIQHLMLVATIHTRNCLRFRTTSSWRPTVILGLLRLQRRLMWLAANPEI